MQGRAGSRRNAVGQCWGCCRAETGVTMGQNWEYKGRIGSVGISWGNTGGTRDALPSAGNAGEARAESSIWESAGDPRASAGDAGGQCQGCCRAEPGTLQGTARDTAGQSRGFQGRAGDSRAKSGMQGQMRGSRGCRGAASGMQEAMSGTLQNRCGGSEDAMGQCRGCRSQRQGYKDRSGGLGDAVGQHRGWRSQCQGCRGCCWADPRVPGQTRGC